MERIIGHRFNDKHQIEYLVKWEDYDDADNTWEPQKHLVRECKEEIIKYHQLRKTLGTHTLKDDNRVTQYLLRSPQ